MAPKKKTREGDSSLKRSQGNPILAELEDSIAVLDDSVPVIEAPKRPLCAYNYFFKYQRRVLLREGNARSFGGLGKVVAGRWKVISPQDLIVFQDLAARDYQRYKLQMKAFNRYKKSLAKGRQLHGGHVLEPQDVPDEEENEDASPPLMASDVPQPEIQNISGGAAVMQGNAQIPFLGMGMTGTTSMFAFPTPAFSGVVPQDPQKQHSNDGHQFSLVPQNSTNLDQRNSSIAEGSEQMAASASGQGDGLSISHLEPIATWQVGYSRATGANEEGRNAPILSDSQSSQSADENAAGQEIESDWFKSLEMAFEAFTEEQ